MKQVARAYPEGEIHVILDNVSTHRSEEVRVWHAQKRNRRIVFHFIPTYSSWLNLVEVLVNLVRAKVIRRGRFPSKEDLATKLLAYIDHFNQQKRIFHWTKPADTIVRSVTSMARH